MNILTIPLPFFDKNMSVEYYLLSFYSDYTVSCGDVDEEILRLFVEAINTLTLDTFTYKCPIFIRIYNASLEGPLLESINEPPKRILFVLEPDKKLTKGESAQILRLKALGYRFAFFLADNLEDYKDELAQVDFCLASGEVNKAALLIRRAKAINPKLQGIVTDVKTEAEYEKLAKTETDYFGGNFFKNPLSYTQVEVEPLKTNYLNLLRLVNAKDFDIKEFSTYVSSDPALAYLFLRMVNSTRYAIRRRIESIKHAATMLGQNELRKWISTTVASLLSSDRPTEITRLSLLRGKFSEDLADVFKMPHNSDGLFLTGLFSLMDVILDLPIESALKVIGVSDKINDALAKGTGDYYKVFAFVREFESGNWEYVAKVIDEENLSIKDVEEAFKNALRWYTDLMEMM